MPLGENLEIWKLPVTNRRTEPAKLSIFSSIEFCLWDAQDDATNFQRNFSTGQVEIEDEVIYHKTEYRERRNHFAYFACSEKLAGFDTQRDAFLGPYRGWDNPAAVERGESFNSVAHGWAPHRLASRQAEPQARRDAGDHLRPGLPRESGGPEVRSARFADDQQDGPSSRSSPSISTRKTWSAAFDALRAYWDGLLGIYQVQSPDLHANRMVNIWNAYQCMATFNMSRSASLLRIGHRARPGLPRLEPGPAGLRPHGPGARARAHPRPGGHPAQDRRRLPPVSAADQARQQRHRQRLQRRPALADPRRGRLPQGNRRLEHPGRAGAVRERARLRSSRSTSTCSAASDYTLERLGPHGLPLIGRADWNDCLNLNCFSDTPGQSFQTTTNKDGKVAESVFIAGLFVLAAKELAAHRRATAARTPRPRTYLAEAAKMEKVIYEHGWDGDGSCAPTTTSASQVGSKECEEGKIFIESQGMCIMAGIGLEDGKAKQALAVGQQAPRHQHGIVLQQPAFSQYYLHLGEISSYPPGYKENAGIFCHNNPWIIIAETMVGNGDRAFDYYTRINPSARENIGDLHRCEPYVFAQMIAGRDAPTHGEAKNSWLTGTAAWNYVAIRNGSWASAPNTTACGFDPCIPAAWQGFTAVRRYRGGVYHIKVNNPNGLCRGVKSLLVDGRRVADNLLPLPTAPGQSIQVEVTLGK